MFFSVVYIINFFFLFKDWTYPMRREMQVGHFYLLFEAKPVEHLMRRKKELVSKSIFTCKVSGSTLGYRIN